MFQHFLIKAPLNPSDRGALSLGIYLITSSICWVVKGLSRSSRFSILLRMELSCTILEVGLEEPSLPLNAFHSKFSLSCCSVKMFPCSSSRLLMKLFLYLMVAFVLNKCELSLSNLTHLIVALC